MAPVPRYNRHNRVPSRASPAVQPPAAAGRAGRIAFAARVRVRCRRRGHASGISQISIATKNGPIAAARPSWRAHAPRPEPLRRVLSPIHTRSGGSILFSLRFRTRPSHEDPSWLRALRRGPILLSRRGLLRHRQHYGPRMNGQYFAALGIPFPSGTSPRCPVPHRTRADGGNHLAPLRNGGDAERPARRSRRRRRQFNNASPARWSP